MIQPAQTSTRRSSCPGFPVVKLTNAARTQASACDITSCFRNEKETLFRLAFLITGDKAQAEASVINAYETTLQGETPFRDWVFEWAKCNSEECDSIATRRDSAMGKWIQGFSLRAGRSLRLQPSSDFAHPRGVAVIAQSSSSNGFVCGIARR